MPGVGALLVNKIVFPLLNPIFIGYVLTFKARTRMGLEFWVAAGATCVVVVVSALLIL